MRGLGQGTRLPLLHETRGGRGGRGNVEREDEKVEKKPGGGKEEGMGVMGWGGE